MDNVHAHAIIEGIVQGVFFRAHTQQEARRLGLSGWVKNRRDGSVEAVFEGDKETVDAVLRWCQSGPPRSRVDNVRVTWEKYTGEFSGFSIEY